MSKPKRWISALLVVMHLVGTIPAAALESGVPVTSGERAAEMQSGSSTVDFSYTLDSDNNATITQYTGSGASLTIPMTLDGYPVVAIGSGAFQDNTGLERVVMQDNITAVGAAAFGGCTNLSQVTLSANLTSIGAYAFYNCDALTAIEIPGSLVKTTDSYISAYGEGYVYGPFYGCDNLENITFQEGSTVIANGLFANCPGVRKLVIPDTVTMIEADAFRNCTNLTEVTLSHGLTGVGDFAFCGCTALTDVRLPDSVTAIGAAAFAECTALQSVDLPRGLTTMGAYTFYNCDALTGIEIPKNLVETTDNYIHTYASGYVYGPFYGCDDLSSVTFEDGTSVIANGLFANCPGLKSVDIPASVAEIGSWAFQNSGLTELVLPNSITSLGENAFYHCDALKTVSLSRNLTAIPAGAFRNCAELESIIVPYFVAEIGENAFASSPKLSKVVTHEKLTSIHTSAFSCPDTTVFYGPAGSYTETWCSSNGYPFRENTAAATAVTVPEASVSIPKGGTYVMDLTIQPAGFAGTITFKSSNTAVATVDEQGKITAVGVGTAVVKVIVGSVSASCTVTVTQAVTKITLDQTTLALEVPETFQLLPTITPADASNRDLAWTSSDHAAATVDEHGVVTAVGNGTAVITAAAQDGSGISASCTVTVTDPNNIPVSGIALSETALSLQALETHPLTATVTPDNAADQTILWTTSDESVAAVDEKGVVTALTKGSAVITAAAADGSGAAASCVVTVTNDVHMAADVSELESDHPYPNSCSDFWVCTVSGAETLRVTFHQNTALEDGFDHLHIYDGEDRLIGSFTGTVLAGRTVEVAGNTVKLQLQSDASGSDWGFKVAEMAVEMHEHQYAGVVTAPTCMEFGYTTYTCDGCGHSYLGDHTALLSHEYAGGVCILCGCPQPETVASGWSGCATWSLTDDGRLTFRGEGSMKNYTYKTQIPWYSYLEQITGVIIEEGITAIGDYAFYGMPELTFASIPGSVTSIGSYAFKNCGKLDRVILPSKLTRMGESAFYACTALTGVEIPASLWTVQPYTFKNCTSLTSVKFHEGNLQKISDGAFYGTALTELALPDCLDILDVYSFKNCARLASITLGGGLTELREAVFYGTAMDTLVIPEGITKIGPYAFKNCTRLKNVALPDTLASVGEASFYACTALKSLELPDGVTSIGNYAFRRCTALRSVDFGSGLTTIGESGFYGCTALTALVIPERVTEIKSYAFKGCTSVASVTLPDSLATIGDSAFHTCTDLKTIEIPANTAKIGAYCFSGSTGLGSITFVGNAPSIGTGAFNKLTATAYYPGDNTTWTADVMQNYGGAITWTAV